MTNILLIGAVGLAIINVILLTILFKRENPWKPFTDKLDSILAEKGKVESTVREEITKNREEGNVNAKQMRDEMAQSLKLFGDSILLRMTEIATLQSSSFDSFSKQLGILTQGNNEKLDKMRETIEQQLKTLREENAKKLDEMRQVVDEKLQSTLDKRLSESFKQVSERLESVHAGLGEMKNLATDVGGLKKVLSNVKTRGIWGEIQLGALLEQMLSPEQYANNVAVKRDGKERVEFAIKLPGNEDGTPVWLPIDSKFPQEDYLRLVEAYEKTDAEAVELAAKQLETRIRNEAKEINEKYIDPPNTTDFAILFLPYESLYAEVIRRPGLCEALQRTYRVTVTCPSTLGALLISLQMGFKTLAIQKRSSEVWNVLGAVKTEFGKFASILEKTHRQLNTVSNSIEDAARKTRTIEGKLRRVQELPESSATKVLKDVEEIENDAETATDNVDAHLALENEPAEEVDLKDIPF